MTTRCPQCGTAFKVVADQLRIRNGFVRCGVCGTVFDGSARLVSPAQPEPEQQPWQPSRRPPHQPDQPRHHSPPYQGLAPAAAPQAPAVLRDRTHAARQPLPPEPRHEDAADDALGEDRENRENLEDEQYDGRIETIMSRRLPASPSAHALHDDFHIDERGGQGDTGEAPDYVPISGETRTRHLDAMGSGRPPPEFLDKDRHARSRAWGRLWGLACLLALVGLVAQGAYVYRSDIATNIPFLRPALEFMCAPLQCRVGYTRHVERISIESSSLQPQNGASAGESGKVRFLLNVVLRNRYNLPQPFPALVLELTDFSDTVIVRKILVPDAYLPSGRATRLFSAGEQIALTVPVDVAGMAVNGYQIDKFFP